MKNSPQLKSRQAAYALILAVPRHSRINHHTPGVDSTCHAGAGFDALLAQPLNHVHTADSVVTIDDQRSFVRARVQVLQCRGYGAHGDQLAAPRIRARLRGEFVRLADITSGCKLLRPHPGDALLLCGEISKGRTTVRISSALRPARRDPSCDRAERDAVPREKRPRRCAASGLQERRGSESKTIRRRTPRSK